MKAPVLPRPPAGLSPEQVHAWFVANGIAITEWCQQYGFTRYVVHDLLRGKRKARRGESHRAAIALGLKPDPAARTKRCAA